MTLSDYYAQKRCKLIDGLDAQLVPLQGVNAEHCVTSTSRMRWPTARPLVACPAAGADSWPRRACSRSGPFAAPSPPAGLVSGDALLQPVVVVGDEPTLQSPPPVSSRSGDVVEELTQQPPPPVAQEPKVGAAPQPSDLSARGAGNVCSTEHAPQSPTWWWRLEGDGLPWTKHHCCGCALCTTRKRAASGAPIFATNGALLVRH